jgi:hypothetical protein
MMISMFFVLLVVPWAIGLASSFGGLINYMLGLAVIVMAAHLITLATVTRGRRRRAFQRAPSIASAA